MLVQKQKSLNLGPKMPYLRIFRLEFKNTIVIFEISVLEFVLLQSLVQKYKPLNLGPKMFYMGTFGLELENNIVIFEFSTFKFV